MDSVKLQCNTFYYYIDIIMFKDFITPLKKNKEEELSSTGVRDFLGNILYIYIILTNSDKQYVYNHDGVIRLIGVNCKECLM